MLARFFCPVKYGLLFLAPSLGPEAAQRRSLLKHAGCFFAFACLDTLVMSPLDSDSPAAAHLSDGCLCHPC
jgi:hypothetical protein